MNSVVTGADFKYLFSCLQSHSRSVLPYILDLNLGLVVSTTQQVMNKTNDEVPGAGVVFTWFLSVTGMSALLTWISSKSLSYSFPFTAV